MFNTYKANEALNLKGFQKKMKSAKFLNLDATDICNQNQSKTVSSERAFPLQQKTSSSEHNPNAALKHSDLY
jgi:hypothetical protein